MPNTYIASPHLLLHVHLPPDQPLSAMPIKSSMGRDASTEALELVHAAAEGWEGSG